MYNVSGVLGDEKQQHRSFYAIKLATVSQRDGKAVFAVVLNAADKAER